MGRVGMSREDFLQLTPEEFEAVLAQYARLREEQMHAGWEQARMIAFAAAAPRKLIDQLTAAWGQGMDD